MVFQQNSRPLLLVDSLKLHAAFPLDTIPFLYSHKYVINSNKNNRDIKPQSTIMGQYQKKNNP